MKALIRSETLEEGLVTSNPGVTHKVEEILPRVSEAFCLGVNCIESVSAPRMGNGGSGSDSDKCSESAATPVASEFGSGVNSGSQIESSIKGISLFVELTGGVKGDGSNCLEENGDEATIVHQECQVGVGDFVWALTKNQSWWPGIVCDSSSVPKEATKVQKSEGSHLVKCFGNGSNYLWCLPSQMKPFVVYFEQLLKQSNTKSFVGALEKAVAEFGRRVKTGLTCSCFSRKIVERNSDLGDFAATQFEPATFTQYIKDLAREISMPSKIQHTVTLNCLSAFYHSLGHCQIPMHQLKPTNDAKDSTKSESTSGIVLAIEVDEGNELSCEDPIADNKDDNVGMENGDESNGEKSERTCESRERRKSRFLTYPYVNLKLGPKGLPVPQELVVDDPKRSLDGADLKNADGQSLETKAKKSRKKWLAKPIAKHDISGIGDDASIHVSDVLYELQCAALDCLFPNGSKSFDSTEGFISRFRTWALNDFRREISIERMGGQELDFQMHPHQIFPNIGVESVKVMGVEDVTGVNTSVNMVGNDGLVQPLPIAPKRREKKDKAVLSPMTGDISASGPVIIDFQNGGSLAPQAQSTANKRKMDVLADEALHHVQVMTAVSDLNRNGTILHFGDPEVTAVTQSEVVPKRRKKKEARDASMHACSNITCLRNLNGHVAPFSIQIIPQQNEVEQLKETTSLHLNDQVRTAPPGFTGNSDEQLSGLNNQVGTVPPGFTVNSGEPTLGLISANDKLETRGRKRKTTDLLDTFDSTLLPDLNGNGADNNPQKKRGRRSRRKQEVGVPCIELSYNKVQQDKEVTGTALLLKFSPDHPLPSNEDLNLVFRKYGSLNEAETQVLNENLSGQVVFHNSSDAGEAFRSLEKDGPFGPVLVNYRVQHLSGGGQAGDVFKASIKIPVGLKPPPNGQAPDLATIRKKLEMMESALEKAGNALSPEMRSKLESEIKGLMNKISNMVGSSSSS